MIKFTDFYGNEIDVTEDYIIELLKKIYAEKVSSIYIAASLLTTFEGITHSFDVRPDILDRRNYWVCKLYVKNKTPNHHYWEESHKIIKQCEERNIT